MKRRTRARLKVRKAVRRSLGVPRNAWVSVHWDVIAGILGGMFMGMIFPFITRVARNELGATQTMLAILSAAPFLGNLIAPIWAQHMEGKAKMPFVLGSIVPSRLLLVGMIWISTPMPFVLMLSALQLMGAFSSPAYTSLMKDIYPDHARGRLMGYVRVGAQIAAFLAAQAAGRLLDAGYSYRFIFPIAGIIGIFSVIAFAKVRTLPGIQQVSAPKPVRSSPMQAWRESLELLRLPTGYRWFAASVSVYGFGNLMAGPLYALYQVDVVKVTNTDLATLSNVASMASIVGAFVWGRLVDHYGAAKSVLWSIYCIVGVGVCYLFGASMPLLIIASALSGFGFAGVELAYMASILRYAERGKAAQYQALHSLLLGIRGVTAPALGLYLVQYTGYKAIFIGTLILMIAGTFFQRHAVRIELRETERA